MENQLAPSILEMKKHMKSEREHDASAKTVSKCVRTSGDNANSFSFSAALR